MPYEDQHGMPPPDWNRYILQQSMPQNQAPVGDPLKWSGRARVDAGGTGELYSEQLIIAGAKDLYPRPWSLIGTLGLSQSAWNVAALKVYLEIILGMGQIQLTQRIVLMDGADPTAGGLCNQQSAANGGPYGETYIRYPDFPFSPYMQRPFAAIGALVGNTVGVRMVVQQGETEIPPAFIAVILGSIAAGAGL